ncbi:hypothetical protein [Amycolatopsis sp. lyj-346]|uniref:hypothetical protein n=1 Tax=Amycolatopsis sp. lyj-346 TaxID=2789289 RepID=UPI003979FDD2
MLDVVEQGRLPGGLVRSGGNRGQVQAAPDRLGDAAHVGWATLHHAAGAWIRESARSLDEHLDEAFADLRALSAEASG